MILLSLQEPFIQNRSNYISNQLVTSLPIINLTLQFSTFLGGNDIDTGYSIAVTEKKDCLVTGITGSSNFPTKNAYDNKLNGALDVFISKISYDGSLLWSTFLGGSNRDRGNALAVANDGSCYIFGSTNSSDFPLQNAYNSTFSGYEDLFLAKFSEYGLILWSTYLGGIDMDIANGITISSDGSCYIVGETLSSNFPVKNAYDSTFNGAIDAFLVKFSSNGTLLWSTYLGGTYGDGAFSVAATIDGSCYITGLTGSYDFPVLNAFDSTPNGDLDCFITKFDANGAILWSSFFGGSQWDEALGIDTTNDGYCYLTGYTGSPDFPIKNAFNSTYSNWGDAFVAKFTTEGFLLWSTFLGGENIDRGYAIAVSTDGSCFITGETFSVNFPRKYALDDSFNGYDDSFVTKFTADGELIWSSYLGGSASEEGYALIIDDDRSCYITGDTYSSNYPILNAFDSYLGNSRDAFVSVLFERQLLEGTITSSFLYVILGFMGIVLLIVIILYQKRN